MGLVLMCADRLLTLFKKRVKDEKKLTSDNSTAHDSGIIASRELEMGKPSPELVVYVPSMSVQFPRACHREQSKYNTHQKPARSRETDADRADIGVESASLPVIRNVDMPPHIPISRDGEETYSHSQLQLSQHLLADDYSSESVRPPPNRTVRPCIADESPPPYRTHSVNLNERCTSPSVYRCQSLGNNNKPDYNRTRTYSDSRRHSRNSSDSSQGSSKSDDCLNNKPRKISRCSSGAV